VDSQNQRVSERELVDSDCPPRLTRPPPTSAHLGAVSRALGFRKLGHHEVSNLAQKALGVFKFSLAIWGHLVSGRSALALQLFIRFADWAEEAVVRNLPLTLFVIDRT